MFVFHRASSAGFGNRVLVGDPLHNSARNGSTAGKITGTKDAHGQCFVEQRSYTASTPPWRTQQAMQRPRSISQWMMQRHLQWRNKVQRWQRRSWAS